MDYSVLGMTMRSKEVTRAFVQAKGGNNFFRILYLL